MGPEIFLIGLAFAGIVGAIKRGCRSSNIENRQEYQESSDTPDVQVLGQVLPEETKPRLHIELPQSRQPGEPLWANHRLYEGLPEQPQRYVRPDYLQNINPPLAGVSMPPVRPSHRPLWQNNRSIEEIIASMRTTNTPSTQGNVRRQRNQQTTARGDLEDPFAEGTVEGWTYRDGEQRSI